MLLREESKRDFEKIYELVKTAFRTAKVSDGTEQELVNKLRNSEYYIPELALVAEEEGRLLGHIMLTKTYILEDSKKHETLLLAPISVLLKYRKRGIGSKLIIQSFERAKALGYTSIVLVGDPNFYKRFGFKKASDFGISYKGIPEEYVLARELTKNALSELRGEIIPLEEYIL
ncbi:MAG: N-acetyltransferase [Methanosarcinaceae archaeon]|nr:N-acetyltransferase [Methanosarcinaceae archaeon]MDD4332205.1 N-acetyltransferase [Methanosarcinaceae archaeon]MDD4748504.1 N-acetyltransferase [Methanosarcinaceae archaeon]